MLFQDDTLLEASEDDQLRAAITASLTDFSKPSTSQTKNTSSDFDYEDLSDDLETFTDSDAGSPCSSHSTPVKNSRGRKNSGSPRKGSVSPAPLRRSRRNSSDSDNGDSVSCDSGRPKRERKQSPLAKFSANEINNEPKGSRSESSPRKTRNVSPLTVSRSSQSPSKGLPAKKCNSSPMKKQGSTPPQKTKSIHNDVHPAVVENIRRHSVSEDDDSRNESAVTESTETSEPVESDHSLLDAPVDSRDYRKFLGSKKGIFYTKNILHLTFSKQIYYLLLMI